MANQVFSRLREAENIYTEAMEAISVTWEQIIDDETTKQLVEKAHQEDLHILTVKADIKKLPTKEKIAKGAELKQLLDKARALHD